LPFNCQKEKKKVKIVLATRLREDSFSYPPFPPHMGNTEIPKKRKERKKEEEGLHNCFMHVHGHTPHPWLKLEQMSELVSVCPVPCH
jgi:hypothetical protein